MTAAGAQLALRDVGAGGQSQLDDDTGSPFALYPRVDAIEHRGVLLGGGRKGRAQAEGEREKDDYGAPHG